MQNSTDSFGIVRSGTKSIDAPHPEIGFPCDIWDDKSNPKVRLQTAAATMLFVCADIAYGPLILTAHQVYTLYGVVVLRIHGVNCSFRQGLFCPALTLISPVQINV